MGKLLRLVVHFIVSTLDFVFYLSVRLTLAQSLFSYTIFNLQPSGADCLHLVWSEVFGYECRLVQHFRQLQMFSIRNSLIVLDDLSLDVIQSKIDISRFLAFLPLNFY